ncbi:MAG: EamA family transporter, partial [Candidatus Sedimenticola endophacoides]
GPAGMDAGGALSLAWTDLRCNRADHRALTFISRGLPRVGVSLAGLIILLQPSLAFCWDVLLFGRPASGTDLAGLALALLGIYLGSTACGRR